MRHHGADSSDEELLAAFRTGRQEAFTLLFRRWSRPVFGHVLGLVKDRDMADEVTQRVFLKLARRPELYTPGTSFASWLHRVARNEALDELKKARRGRADPEADPTGIPTPSRQEETGENAELARLVHKAFETLEGIQREVLVLREYSELSYREIAAITGRSLANVKQDIFQARQALRAHLAPLLERESPGWTTRTG
jgi:RNA polymerase sigma-70 factor (ECF subfamily)